MSDETKGHGFGKALMKIFGRRWFAADTRKSEIKESAILICICDQEFEAETWTEAGALFDKHMRDSHGIFL